MTTAIILAAGKSTRTYPLTITKPKPLLKVFGKTIIEHTLKQLDDLVDDVIIVIGYLGEQIKKKIGNSFGKLNISYIVQEEQDGTGSALFKCKDKLSGKFLVLNGDDFYSKKDNILIAGDVLFQQSIGRTDLPGGNHETLLNSIRTKLFSLNDETVVYSGHGPATSIGFEKQNNPFLN